METRTRFFVGGGICFDPYPVSDGALISGGAASDLGNQRGWRRRFECGALLSGLPLGGLGAAGAIHDDWLAFGVTQRPVGSQWASLVSFFFC